MSERLGGPAQWNCADVKIGLAYLSVDELDGPARERIEAIPTRLSLKPDQIDAAIEGARAGRSRCRSCAEYLRERVIAPASGRPSAR